MNYYDDKTYLGRNGAMVTCTFRQSAGKKSHVGDWLFRFVGCSRTWFVGGKTTFDAILSASRLMGRSMKAMDWKLYQ